MTGNVLISRRRLLVVLIVLVVLLVLLIFRVGYWNIVRGADLQEEAEGQWISDSVVNSNRGSIMDRNQNILAQSAAADTVVLLPKNIEDPNTVATALSQILEMDQQDVLYKASTKTRIDDEGKEKDIVEVWLKRQITTEQSEQIKDLNLKGVKLISDIKRYYPNKSFAAQVIGYTSADGEGQTGIEKRYNSILEGRQGRMVAETDKFNNDIPNGQEMFIEPVDGQNVMLTIDEVMQSFLESACAEALQNTGAESVQGAVMDVTNGEIMAMANMPEFDLNDPPRSDAQTLSKLSANVITASAYEPGSLFTLFTAAGARDAGLQKASYTCNGAISVDGTEILCSAKHGTQTFEQAVLNHCSVAASQMAAEMDHSVFYGYLKKFGFGEKTGIDFTTDSAGDVMEAKYASGGDIAKMGAGENLKVSELQIMNAVMSLVDGGELYVPRLVLALADQNGNITESYQTEIKGNPVSEATAGEMKSLMREQVLTGKAQAAQITGYSSGAVFGASQKYDASGALVQGKEISTFLTFAPADQPKYIVMITLNGIDTSETADVAAAPYAKQVLEEILKFANVQPDDQGAHLEEKVAVPNVVEMDLQTAAQTLQDAGLSYTADGTGTVKGQVPAAGEEVYKNTAVALTMDTKSVGETENTDMVTVPDFSGMTFEAARDLAISTGLRFYAQGTGVAQAQYPVYGTNVQKGSAVTVTFRLQLSAQQ